MKVIVKNFKEDEKIINKIYIKAKPSNILKIKEILDDINDEDWSVAMFIINMTEIDPLHYLQGWMDIYDYNEADYYLGTISSYSLIDEKTIEFEIVSYTEYDVDMIKDFFLSDIIDTKTDKENKIKELQNKIEVISSQLEKYKKQLEEVKNIDI